MATKNYHSNNTENSYYIKISHHLNVFVSQLLLEELGIL